MFLQFITALIIFSLPAMAYEGKNGNKDSTIKVCSPEFPQECLVSDKIPKPLIPLTLERIIDGDTIVASERKIRLWGINAPEKNEPLFKLSTMFLQALLKDGELACKQIEKDRYERDVMHCFVDKADIGSMMVQLGMAKDYKKYSGGYYQTEESLAKDEKRGVWKTPINQAANNDVRR